MPGQVAAKRSVLASLEARIAHARRKYRHREGLRQTVAPISNLALRSLLQAALREPFFHFLVLGALLFAFNEYLEARSNYSHIEISKEQIRSIANNYQLQYGGPPTPVQLKSLVDSFIREEVFYHEALRLNLDKDDEIIRRRLVQKYEFLQQDLGIAREPTEEDLLAYYQQHQEKYSIPEKVSFTHVYFSPDQRGEEGARSAALAALGSLSKQGLSRAPEVGDRFPGLNDYSALPASDVARLFGNEGVATEAFKQPLHHWAGPFRSGYGWHVLQVNGKQAPTVAPYDLVKEAVRRDYTEQQRSLRNAETLEKLKKSFTIVVEQ